MINSADSFEFLPKEQKISSILCWRDRLDRFAPQIGQYDGVKIIQDMEKSDHSCVSVLKNEPCEKVEKLLTRSLAWIGESSPPLYTFIGSVSNQIIVQRDHERKDYYGLSSYREPGTIRIVNPDALGQSVSILSSAIIHESIHQYLFLLERSYGYFLSPDLFFSQERLQSPWTGSLIYYNNVCHAAAVWYGLFHYWGIATKYLHGDERTVAQNQRKKIKSGFSGESYQTLISAFASHKQSFAVTLLTHIRHLMTEDT